MNPLESFECGGWKVYSQKNPGTDYLPMDYLQESQKSYVFPMFFDSLAGSPLAGSLYLCFSDIERCVN